MININFGNMNFTGGNNQDMQQMTQICAEHPECKDCPADKKDIQIGQSAFRCETSLMKK